MTITIKRYVDITSGVIGATAAATRELIGLIFTTSSRVPSSGVLTITTAREALQVFGAASEEYRRASFYFNFISKATSRPKALSFARYFETAAAPSIFGAATFTTLDTWKSVISGAFTITIGGVVKDVTGLDFSAVTSFADVASTLQTAFSDMTEPQFSSSVVTFNELNRSFDFTNSVAGAGEISTSINASGTDVLALLGWYEAEGAVYADGNAAETPIDAFLRAADRNNNFGSFLFISELDENEKTAIARANSGRNVEFMYCVRVTPADAPTISAAMLDLSGVAITLAPDPAEFDEMAPMIILAATDYNRRNASQNYMFQNFDLTAKVETNAMADYYDRLRVNYMGLTQTAGRNVKFYQRGAMTGLSTTPLDMNTYANEMWLKDQAAAAIMSLLLAETRVPATDQGRGQVLAILNGVIDLALRNGTISVGKLLSDIQKQAVMSMSDDPLAWHQIQTSGFWITAWVEQYQSSDNRTEYKIRYLLIYSKDDAVRKVEGTHSLV